ncbi:hypothetical protein [Adhaeribacter rhizoryzae]|uniref:Uncharacterized protein n=1 Tax=Adhaeribacter rhizoryzae TaxID=2607907 RepID=A0A5M6DAI2_9BACT|nr:hypothetical protein [Adhaeribacter rhizoryzae]KAA5543536.1 hypothetical protein F0145_16600 [Adhaeribacter rhizoryzae]
MADRVDMQEGKSQGEHDNTGKKVGVSGQQPGTHEGSVTGGAANTRGENKPSWEASTGGAKKGKENEATDLLNQTHANPSDARGADSSDKQFRNNQSNAGLDREK